MRSIFIGFKNWWSYSNPKILSKKPVGSSRPVAARVRPVHPLTLFIAINIKPNYSLFSLSIRKLTIRNFWPLGSCGPNSSWFWTLNNLTKFLNSKILMWFCSPRQWPPTNQISGFVHSVLIWWGLKRTHFGVRTEFEPFRPLCTSLYIVSSEFSGLWDWDKKYKILY